MLLFFYCIISTYCTTLYDQRPCYRRRKRGESLISSSIFEIGSSKGTVTNNFGYYSLTIPAGQISLKYSYVGYSTSEQTFYLQSDTALNIRLFQDAVLQEVTVTGDFSRMGVKSSQMSAIEIPVNQIKKCSYLIR